MVAEKVMKAASDRTSAWRRPPLSGGRKAATVTKAARVAPLRARESAFVPD